jgi:hypothetical protein
MLDRSDMWKEYMGLRGEASKLEQKALDLIPEDPRAAEVAATVAVSIRLEALTYIISKARIF